MPLVRAEQDQEFADEAVEHRQAERRERGKQKESGQLRHWRGEPAVFADFKSVPPVVEHADEQEKRARGYPVSEHLVDSALHGNVVEREDAQHHEAEVADR